MKKILVRGISLLVVAVMMTVLFAGCYSTTGYYFYNGAQVDFQQDDNNNRVKVSVSFIERGNYTTYTGTSSSYSGSKRSITVSVTNEDGLRGRVTVTATLGNLGASGSKASLSATGDSGKTVSFSAVSISK